MGRHACRVLVGALFVLAAGHADARPGGGGAFSGPSPRPATETKPAPAPRPAAPPARSPRPSPSPTPTSTDDDRPARAESPAMRMLGIVGTAFVFSLIAAAGFSAWRTEKKRELAAREKAASPQPVAPPPPPSPAAPRPGARRELLRLREVDPDFSLVLFDDLLVLLYTELKIAQGSGELARYAPYLGDAARVALGTSEGAVTTVLVGAASMLDVEGVEPPAPRVRVKVRFESNLAVGSRAVYAREVWTFERRRDARSRAPARAKVLGCPSCGSPLDLVVAGACKHCGSQVTAGDFDWSVTAIAVEETTARGPMLTSDVVEQGTELATVVADGAAERLGDAWDDVARRVREIFTTFQAAWSARDLAAMRPLMSDALFAAQSFWVEEYRRQGLANVTEGAEITKLELADATEDAHYEAVTVRVHASSLDYTLEDATGAVVSGSRTTPRRYTEYWTIIRGRPAEGAAAAKECPRCGAPVDVAMAGQCGYCKAKITRADFDWVLSRIEQDEVYRG